LKRPSRPSKGCRGTPDSILVGKEKAIRGRVLGRTRKKASAHAQGGEFAGGVGLKRHEKEKPKGGRERGERFTKKRGLSP